MGGISGGWSCPRLIMVLGTGGEEAALWGGDVITVCLCSWLSISFWWCLAVGGLPVMRIFLIAGMIYR